MERATLASQTDPVHPVALRSVVLGQEAFCSAPKVMKHQYVCIPSRGIGRANQGVRRLVDGHLMGNSEV